MDVDYGEFYKYDIDDLDEFTTIGGVANIAAKITSAAPKKHIYITHDLYVQLPSDLKECFSLLDEQDLREIQERLKGNPNIYQAKYSDLFSDDSEIEQLVEDVKKECNTVANSMNLSDMQFENANAKINFSILSRKKSKHISAGVLYADIRGFTKLFNVSENNLDSLAIVLQDIYKELNQAVEQSPLSPLADRIGIVERLIVITLALFNQYTAIGIIFAIKGVARKSYAELNDFQGEIYFLGTGLSFFLAIVTALLIKWLLVVVV